MPTHISANEPAPKVFISYSWTSEEHQKWVEDLAVRLNNDGVNVVVDFWELREGQDKYVFMEKMITDPAIKRVLIIMDKRYKEKADARSAGVGSESQIISSELYGKADQTKFIPIVKEKDHNGDPFTPIYLNTRIYINLSSDSDFATQYEALLRNIYERPARQRPALGKKPTFLDEANPGSTATRILLGDFLKAIENGTPNALGHLSRFFDECINSLSAYQLPQNTPEPLDELIVSKIQELKPLRDEVLRATAHLSLYLPNDSYIEKLHGFFERAAAFQERPQKAQRWHSDACDHYKFWLRELFMSVITQLLKDKRYSAINFLTETEYLYSESGETHTETFRIFDEVPRSLFSRNDRLQLRRISLAADLIKERADFPNVSFEDLMQTDFILTLKAILPKGASRFSRWFPSTLALHLRTFGPLPLFKNLASSRAFEVVKALFHAPTPLEFLKALDDAYMRHDLEGWRFDMWPIEFHRLAGLEDFRKRQSSRDH